MATKFIRCKVCGAVIPQSAKVCPRCYSNNKQPFYKKGWFWAIVCCLLLWKIICFFLFIAIFFSGSDDSQKTEVVATTEVIVESTAEQATEAIESTEAIETIEATEEALIIELIAGEPGEYGELFTMNKGTEFEETYYIYHIPAGTYRVTNIGKYMNQFNVYSDEVHVVDGWEEPAEVIYVKLLDVGASDTFTIEDGQHIEIHGPGGFRLEKED